MCHVDEAVSACHPLLSFAGEAFFNLDHLRTLRANQMMVVSRTMSEFKTCHAISQVNAADQLRCFKHFHRAINRGKVAISWRQRPKDLLARNRAPTPLKHSQDGLPRTSELPRMPPQSLGQINPIQ